MPLIFHGNNEEAHNSFQAWRKANLNGFHMTESKKGSFVIHYSQDMRENPEGRGCNHQGGSGNQFGEVKGGCYTTARKVCANSLAELLAWAATNGFTTRSCKNCDSRRFPFPKDADHSAGTSGDVTSAGTFVEGAPSEVVVSVYERNSAAKDTCIAHYGSSCMICGFDFGLEFGPQALGYIHVHHIRPLSTIRAEYQVDPIADLRPVCPNCHAVIHHGGGCRSIEEVQHLLTSARQAQ